MRHISERFLCSDPRLAAACDSFEALCDSIDLIIECKRDPNANMRLVGRKVKRAKARHLEKHIALYGRSGILPKHHACQHEGDQIAEDEYAWDMFVIERLNLRPRFLAEIIDNTTIFEHSLLSSIFIHNTNDLRDGSLLKWGLRGTQTPMDGYPGATQAAKVTAFGKHFT